MVTKTIECSLCGNLVSANGKYDVETKIYTHLNVNHPKDYVAFFEEKKILREKKKKLLQEEIDSRKKFYHFV